VSSPIAVVGIGNVLLRDDGAGVWLVRRLAEGYRFTHRRRHARTRVVVPARGHRTLLGDRRGENGCATRDGLGPNRCRRSCSDAPGDIGARRTLNDLLAALTLCGKAPRELIVVAIEPDEIRPFLDLSLVVQDALPLAEKIVIGKLETMGVSAFRRGRSLDYVFSL
jgi:hydrogenase maturation protease